METDIKGLYAAGEVTSGLFGAFRAGDGLSEMLAQGYRAGVSAAEYAGGAEPPRAADAQARALIQNLERVRSGGRGPRSSDLLQKLEQTADEGMGVVRDQTHLDLALEQLRQIEMESEQVAGPNTSRVYDLEFYDFLTLRNLLLCIKCGLTAALQRQESRGTHLRSDFPQVDNEHFFYRISHRLEGSTLFQEKIVPQPGPMVPPGRNYDHVCDYLADML